MEAFGVKCLASQGASDVTKESSFTAINIIIVNAKVMRMVTMQRLFVVTFKAKVGILFYINCGLRLCDKASFNRQDSYADMLVMKSLQIS